MIDPNISYKILFSKVQTTHNKVGDEKYEGYCQEFPEVGKQFYIKAFPSGQSFNLGRTSVVKHVERDGKVFTIYTSSGSIYKVIILEFISFPDRL